MPYSKTTWVDNSTPDISAANLNNLEDGAAQAARASDATANKVPVSQGTSAWLYQLLANAQIDPAAAIALSKLADPGSGNVVTSAGAGTIAAKPPGYKFDKTTFTSAVGSITGVNIAGATSIVTSGSVTYDGATEVLIEFFCPSVTITVGGDRVKFELFEDSTDIGELFVALPSTAAASNGVRAGFFRTPSNAAHTYTVKAFVPDGGTATVGAGGGGAATAVPGWIRVTKSA